MEDQIILKTIDGKPIYSTDYIDALREEDSKVPNPNRFIAHPGAQENDLHSTVDILITGGNRGGGKANPYFTPVATPTGFRKMGDLQVGDLICTPYEGVQRVSEIFEQGENIVYLFHFDDGTTLDCMDNHRFWARSSPNEDFHVMTAREIMDNYVIDRPFPLSLRKTSTNYVEIPLCGEVELNEQRTVLELPLHPFVLGYLSSSGYWELAPNRIPLSGNIWDVRMLYKYGHTIKKDKREGKYYIRGLSEENLKRITCARGRHLADIPDEYMTASVNARWDYLQGIMFRGGRSYKTHPYLELPNRQLIMKVAQLARSLGIWARVNQVENSIDHVGYWRVIFAAPNDETIWAKQTCFNHAQHRANVPTQAPVSYTTPVLTKKLQYITKSKRKYKCRCITITGKEHLYMTDAYTINHNTALMLMEDLYDITNKHYYSVLFRKNKDDFRNIENESSRWFMKLGRYNKSKDDMTWNFKTGAKMSFDHFDMTLKDFEDKYRGQQIAYFGIDELPQMPFEFLKILMGSNRNTVGVRSRILGTCNPDPLSWLRRFIDWWIGKEDTIYSDGKKHPERKGLPIPERDGVVRYCFMGGKTVDDIKWGDTPEEVYEQCKNEIDSAWDADFEKYGYDKISFAVKSVTFIKASIKENHALLRNDPGYIASILNKSPEERAQEWDCNWDVIELGDDMIQPYHLDRIFTNAHELDDKVRRATCDVAGTGGDNCVTWFWIGWHVADVYVCRRDPYSTVNLLKAKLQEWGVLEQNFTYDLNGMGQVLKGGFPNAIPFNNQEAVSNKDRGLYDCVKSQCAYKFAERTQQCQWSIENTLLYRRYKVGGETKSLRDILQIERRCVRQDMSKADKGWCLIHKEQMKNKSLVGHSPDFFEALFMREIFDIKETTTTIPLFLQGHIKRVRSFG